MITVREPDDETRALVERIRGDLNVELIMEKDLVIEALRVDDVLAHYQIPVRWRGRWARSRRCPTADHQSDAFGVARDGMWHCHACNAGGDMLKMIAAAEALDIRTDFPKVLELAAGIAGVETGDDFGGAIDKPKPPPRPPIPELPPLRERLDLAKKRARFVWSHLYDLERAGSGYLRSRGINPEFLVERESIKATPMLLPAMSNPSQDMMTMRSMFSVPGIAVPVRNVVSGELVDVRVRRYEPRDGQPKVVGMLGGLVREEDELVGCYGFPHDLEDDDRATVIVVEGLADYLTATVIFPGAFVLGATDAGNLPLVAAFAASKLAARPDAGRLCIVEQTDNERTTRDGRTIPGAADVSVNLQACKRAISILGMRRVGHIECAPHKDLNAMLMADAAPMERWFVEPEL